MSTKTRLFKEYELAKLELLQHNLVVSISLIQKMKLAIEIKETKEKINLLESGEIAKYLCYNS